MADLDGKPDPQNKDRILLESRDGSPIRGTLDLKGGANHLKLEPDSFVIIGMEGRSWTWHGPVEKSDDKVTFVLPSENPADYRWQNEDTHNARPIGGQTIVLTRAKDGSAVSGVTYADGGRGVSAPILPEPDFVTPSGKLVKVRETPSGGAFSLRTNASRYALEAPFQPAKSMDDSIEAVVAHTSSLSASQRSALQAALSNASKSAQVDARDVEANGYTVEDGSTVVPNIPNNPSRTSKTR